MEQVIQLKQHMVEVLKARNNLSTIVYRETNLAKEKLQVQIHEIGMDNQWDIVNRKEFRIIMTIDIIQMIDIIQIKRI